MEETPPDGVTSITLDDGAVLTWDMCEGLEDEYERENCRGVFSDVASSRRRSPRATAAACEQRLMTEYREVGWNFEQMASGR
jgi:hypothetical protein